MDVDNLKSIAYSTHQGHFSTENNCVPEDYGIGHLNRYLDMDIENKIHRILNKFGGPIIVADVGCCSDTAAFEMGQIGGVYAFYIDIQPRAPKKLQPNRAIKADVNDMNQIPEDSFHMLVGNNFLQYTDYLKCLPEFYRVLVPGGYACFDMRTDMPTDYLVNGRREFDMKRVEGLNSLKGLVDYLKIRIRGDKTAMSISKYILTVNRAKSKLYHSQRRARKTGSRMYNANIIITKPE